MNEETLKIVYDLNKNSRILSQNDIYSIFESLINFHSLDNYCTSINVDSKDNNTMAYFWEEKELTVNYKKLLAELKKEANLCKNIFGINQEEIIYLKNLYILLVIIHEITHVRQNEIRENNKDNSVFAALIRACYNVCEKKGNSFYTSKYDYFYDEYHAEINALYTIITKVLKEIAKEKTLIAYIFNYILASYLIGKYKFKNEEIITPVEIFNERCLKSIPLDTKFIETAIQRRENVEDILQGRIITLKAFEYAEDVSYRYKRTLNLFNEIY